MTDDAHGDPHEIAPADDDSTDVELFEPEYLPRLDKDSEAVQALMAACASAGIPASLVERDNGGPVIDLMMKAGRHDRQVRLYDNEGVETFVGARFERFRYLARFNGIYSLEDRTVEVAVRSLQPYHMSHVLSRLTGRTQLVADDPDDTLVIAGVDDDAGTTLTLGLGSDAFTALCVRPRLVARRRQLTLTVKGLAHERHDELEHCLSTVADAFFFSVDQHTGVALIPVQNRPQRFRTSVRAATPKGGFPFPRFAYDDRPMKLYWYGRSAVGMPLLQFLAFYQVIEYYFPVYSDLDAQRTARSLLKDPRFDPANDNDLARLVSALRPRGGAFGDERSQLKVAVAECVDLDQIISFVEEDTERGAFLSKKHPGLTDVALPMTRPDALSGAVADRIYDVRCRIVHTKGAGKAGAGDILLPFSDAAEAMQPDIDLVRFVACQVLINRSTTLRL